MMRDYKDQERAKEKAASDMFPVDSPKKLSMMSRTPPHMIMPMVELELLVDLSEWAIDESLKSKLQLKNHNDGFIDQAELTKLGFEGYKAKYASGLNMIKQFIERWDRRMIGRDGRGREDMKDIVGMTGPKSGVGKDGKLILE